MMTIVNLCQLYVQEILNLRLHSLLLALTNSKTNVIVLIFFYVITAFLQCCSFVQTGPIEQPCPSEKVSAFQADNVGLAF